MRLASMLLGVASIVSPLAPSTLSAVAQTPAVAKPLPPCAGVYSIIRVSEIKPGQMQKFLDAVAAQQKWYRNKGLIDQIILDRLADDKTGGYSESTVLTQHITSASTPDRGADEDYKAFVAMFQASSTIKTAYYTCQLSSEPTKPVIP